MRPSLLAVLLTCLSLTSEAATWTASFPYMQCSRESSSSFLISTAVANPAVNTYCFMLIATDCHDTSSACCSKTDFAAFVLDATSSCDGASITATLDTRPISNVTVVRPPKATSNSSRLLLIPELHLNATSIRPNGSQLCITLPSSGKCSSLKALSASGRNGRWSASLLSSNGVCCPVSRGRTKPPAPPKGTCQTCIVYDILGPDGTAATAKYDYFSRNSCSLPELSPDVGSEFANCCDLSGFFVADGFGGFRGPNGTVLSGFDRPFCNRTSLRLCGTLASRKAGREMLDPDSDNPFSFGLIYFFDIRDDSYPMALYNSTLRVYTTEPGSDKLDTKCLPINDSTPPLYFAPTREDSYMYNPDNPHFPNETCQSDPGVTPFTVDPYLQVIWANTTAWAKKATNLYCVDIGTATPLNASSVCGRTTSISRVSLWLYDDRKEMYLGAYLLTRKGGSAYTTKQLDMTWGPTGDNAMIISLPNGLDVPTVNATQPKVCVEMVQGSRPVWENAVDSVGYVWTALFDNSGKCCPTYYSNRY
ncbi:hypothetical protein Agub_g2416 [Astrephomene gubernaculifera]|uniref:Pherophorin domain-containing protein n=1 Tax=Astrephomene gubernaculifera TaxID=47775 RepID=A0AAD3DJ30_9CHLO|nr:hypothetical protein Agub_g2416 [Astrephomene gubernaculifera]